MCDTLKVAKLLTASSATVLLSSENVVGAASFSKFRCWLNTMLVCTIYVLAKIRCSFTGGQNLFTMKEFGMYVQDNFLLRLPQAKVMLCMCMFFRKSSLFSDPFQ